MSGQCPITLDLKNSDSEWLGYIPTHWNASKFGYLKTVLTDYTANGSFADLKKYVSYKNRPSFARLVRLTDLRKNIANLDGVWIDEAAYTFLSKSALFGGEFLLANVGAHAGLFYQMPFNVGHASLAPNMFMAKFDRNKISTEFMAFVGQSHGVNMQLRLFATASSAQPKINKDNFKAVRFAYPGIEEQQKIANFLDHETAKIDTLIEKQQQLIKLLKEKKQAVISHAVTKGLNPDAPMKDSGVEWLGEVPEGWVACRLKYVVRKIVDGAHFTPTYVDDGVPFLRVTDIQDEEIDKNNIKYIPMHEHLALIERCKPEFGDLLLSKNGTIGIPKIVDWDWEFSIFVSLCLIKFNKTVNVKFAFYIFLTHQIRMQIFGLIKQSTVINLHLDKIENFWISLPSLAEQAEIVEVLEIELPRIDLNISNAEKLNRLSRERRTALISAAVTGKIDVRNWQPPKAPSTPSTDA